MSNRSIIESESMSNRNCDVPLIAAYVLLFKTTPSADSRSYVRRAQHAVGRPLRLSSLAVVVYRVGSIVTSMR
jgi:hypothetical protein